MLMSCTLFKLSEYQECEVDGDCVQGFEICNDSYLCQTESALCYWSTGYQEPLTSTHTPEGAVLGVLSDKQHFSAEGAQSSAYLGLHSGLRVVNSALQTPATSLLVCNPEASKRDQALQVFRDHNVRVIIGTPRSEDINGTSGDEAYISIGLQPTQATSVESGWLNLAPHSEGLTRAFESISSTLLDHFVAQRMSFNLMNPVQQKEMQPDFIQDVIWRLSPYETEEEESTEPIWVTLLVYYKPTISIDQKMLEFLSSVRPLRAFVSYEALGRGQVNNLTTTTVEQNQAGNAQGPLWIYSAFWEVVEPLTSAQGYWSDVIQLGFTYGAEYSETERPATATREAEILNDLQISSAEVANLFEAHNTQALPYFSFAYDAAVIASIVGLVSSSETSPREALKRVTESSPTDEVIGLSSSGVSQALSLQGDTAVLNLSGRRLFGLTGVIKHRIEGDSLPLNLACSRSGSDTLFTPVTSLQPEDYRVLSVGITNRFEIDPTFLTRCESM